MRGLLPLSLALSLAVLGSAALAKAQDRQDGNTDAQAQNALTVASPAPAAAQGPAFGHGGGPAYYTWQLSIGYQFNWDTLFDRPRFDTNGVNFSVARFFNSWFAVEGQMGAGFGNTGLGTLPENLQVKSIFIGGGPKFAYRTESRWEPWGHFLLGVDHLRITQTGITPEGVILGSNSTFGYMFGGGVDYHIGSNFAIRGEGDYLGTHYFGANHRNAQVVGAFIFDF